jgi:regulator of protease activity HflC (stomatin/prohibitin superfamily)
VETFSNKKVKLEVSGQELLTKDKYSLRINTSVYYGIDDITKYYENY